MHSDSNEIQWNGHTGVVVDEKDGYKVVDCIACQFKHVIPLPSEQELKQVYQEEYYKDEKPQYVAHYLEDKDWWDSVYAERYQVFSQYVPTNSRKVVDIGAGPGLFALRGQELGWEVVAVEPSKQAALHIRELGVEVVEAFIDDKLVEKLDTYDVVHTSAVLEHIPNPREFLLKAARLLKPEGIMCIVVPNDYNIIQNALRDSLGFRPWWLAPPHHINYFNFDSLAGLVESCGMEVVERTTTFPIDAFLMMGDNYIDDPSLGRMCHAKRKAFELNMERAGLGNIKSELYRTLAEKGIGREVVLYCRRKSA
ncbi:MAG: class I SAM-dependent methyltransferase [Gammaproteobacteria bacterium]|nr:class I SAM-dependent methyltransferase [Gammaproteobacteria bacterium]